METALFHNFSNKDFVGFWDGKPRKFAPGESKLLPAYLARHFAKHLTNRELLEAGKERDTSPKLKVRNDGTEYYDNVNFLELYNKAYIPEDIKAEDVSEKDSVEVQVEVASQTKDPVPAKSEEGQAQIITSPDDGEDDDSESSFENDPNKQ